MKSSVSYVIPAFNAVQWVTECLESIFNGNFQRGDEVIVIDDGSTDGTGELLEKLSGHPYPKLKVFHNDYNIGCPATRNIGIGAAKNEFIMNVDSDNILPIGLVPAYKKYQRETGADMVHCKEIQFFWKQRENLKHRWVFEEGQYRLEDLLAGHYSPGPAGNFLHSKAGWEEVGGYWAFDDGTHEAWAYTFKRLVWGHKFFIMPFGHYLHRFGTDGLWARPTWKQKSAEVSNLIIKNYAFMLEPDDRDYILDNSEVWFKNLNKRPLRVFGRPPGKNGRRLDK